MQLPNPARRRLLLGAGAFWFAAPAILRATPAPAPALRLPDLDPGRLAGGLRTYDLTVSAGQAEFFAGHLTDTIGINAPYLGPLLTMKAGDPIRLNVTNRLSDPAALHWHGLHLPARADGGPHQPIAPGTTWSPEFTVMQKAGSFWFHAHQHQMTGVHVWAGMAGLIRIEDDEEAALPLPRTYGEDDFSLVLQDRSFDADFQMPYAPQMHERMGGMQGDRTLVNGQLDPVLSTSAPLIRLRILNGANGSIYRLHFADGRGFHQIASDGGLLAAPVALNEALIAPAERCEFLLDLHDGQLALLRAELFSAESPFAGPSGIRDVLTILPDRPRAAPSALPLRLADLPPPPPQTGDTRHFDLTMTGAGLMGDPTINGQSYVHDRIDFTVPLGTTETWVFENKTEMLHPMHIHDVQFRILSRNGAPPAPQEAGLKDVVLTHPGEKVELRLAFNDYADPLAPYMMHCHILEHEDAGMMAQFTVV